MDEELKQMAMELLWIAWRGIGSAYKSRYRQTIWEQFENQVRASAYTNNLGKFINSLCSKLDSQIQGQQEIIIAEQILNSGNDKTLLRLFRDETTLIVLMVRVRNQERREAWEARQEKEEIADLFSTVD
jgi:hypothetical protein